MRRLALMGVLACAVWLAPTGVDAQRLSESRGVAQRVHQRGGYPDRLPVGGEGVSQTHGEGFEGSGGGGGRVGEREERNAGSASSGGAGGEPVGIRRRGGGSGGGGAPFSLGGASSAFTYLLMFIAVLVFIAVVVGIVRSLGPRGLPSADRSASRERARQAGDEPAPAIRMVDSDPDELAAAGRFEDAIAAVLIRAFRSVGWRPVGKGRSRTAREILWALGRHDPRFVPLEGLVSLQERIAFAGGEATRERYEAARALFAGVREPALGEGPS